jgi:DNA-binding transcriptional LysR family regulator
VVAHGVEQQLETAEADGLEDLHHHLYDFGIDHGRFRTDGFGADLEELTIAAFLRALPAEHGANVVEFLHARPLVEAMFDVGPDHRSRVLGTQREGGLIAVRKGVHFLGDDIGVRADAARKKLGFLEDRGADLVVVVGPKNGARSRLHPIPNIGGWRQ